jgi:hypothetical protein
VSNVQFIISNGEDGRRSATAFSPSQGPLVADNTHPAYEEIEEALIDGATDEEIVRLFDASAFVAENFDRVTERVSVAAGRVFFDGDEQHDAVARQIVAVLNEGGDVLALARFMEKLAANPSARSREQLYEWLNRHAFTIDQDGDVVAYKGVTSDLKSIHHGPAIVDGEAVNGAVPNHLGAVVEIARSAVVDDAANGCAFGLHVGTYAYASSWAQGATLTVKVNPRDVVSVPTASDAQKVRVSRYRVTGIAECKIESAFVDSESWLREVGIHPSECDEWECDCPEDDPYCDCAYRSGF